MATYEILHVGDDVREWTAKQGPAAGQTFKSYAVRAKCPDGMERNFEVSRKPDSPPPPLGAVEAEVKPSQGDFPDKLKLSFSGRQNGSGGSSRSGNDLPPEFWEARDKRLARAGMLQAVVSNPGIWSESTGSIAEYVAFVNKLTDALLASLDERAPSPNASQDGGANPPSLPASSSLAGPSDKQLDFLERLLQEAGVDVQDRLDIAAWAKEKLTGGKEGTMSAAIDAVKSGTADRLITAAKAWVATQSDIPADTRDLQPAPDTFIADDESIPF
jgi:hypothetical protein